MTSTAFSLQLRCISSAKCMGAGDALREMDGLGLIRSNPFIIIRCVGAWVGGGVPP